VAEEKNNSAPTGRTAATCPRCGRPLPPGVEECPDCSGHWHFNASRQSVVLLSLLCLVALFVFAGFVTRKFREHEEQMARQWYERGEAELKAGHAEAALNPLRTALVYSREKPEYELSLAKALVAGGHYSEAQTYLLTLWERQPGSATVNLELARLAARNGNDADAVRYYEASIYGVWESNGEEHRRAVRLELIHYLAAHGRSAEALAETIAFSANLPPDPILYNQAGDLFLGEKSYDRALEQFRSSLQLEPRNADALAGAGRAAFENGDYAVAARYLERASRAEPGNASTTDLLALVRAVLSLDPEAPGLSAQARAARAERDFALAQARLTACPAPPKSPPDAPLNLLAAQAKQLEPKLRKHRLARDMDLYTETVEFAFQAAREARAVCGIGSVDDRALVLLALRRESGAR
jgi:tetratricopeptide (TPR) repeat protein